MSKEWYRRKMYKKWCRNIDVMSMIEEVEMDVWLKELKDIVIEDVSEDVEEVGKKEN